MGQTHCAIGQTLCIFLIDVKRIKLFNKYYMKLTNTLQKVGFGLIVGTTFLLPLFFLPFTTDFFEFNKQSLLVFSTAVLLVIWSVSFIAERQVRLTRSPYGVPMLALLAVFLAATFMKSPNLFDTIIQPGQTGSIIALVFFFFSAINLIRSRNELDWLTYALFGSNAVLAITGILWASGLMPKVFSDPFFKAPIWTLSGNPLATIVLLLSLIPFQVIMMLKDKTNSVKTLLLSISILISVVASGLLGYRLFAPNSVYSPIFLSQSASWAIAMETLKTSPLLGTGPATFMNNFVQYRPISFNLTKNWAVRFGSSSNYYLQTLSTLGILGLLSYLLIASRTFNLFMRAFRNESHSSLHAIALGSSLTAVILFAVQLFIPPTLVTLFVIFALLSVSVLAFKQLGSSLVHEANIDIVAASDNIRAPILPWISLILSLALVIPSLYIFGRAYLADYTFQKALVAASANLGNKTYETMISAIQLNPYRDSYRVAYSQTNILLANNLAAKENLTADDKNTITQLVQQAIREAKNAVALNPKNIANVENLAAVYRNLITFAQGADAWTVASYRQAVVMDPVNPTLRIALGGVMYSLQQYDDAIKFFQQAADLKPDYANAYYNLAAAYSQKGDFKNAYIAMQTVVNLVDRSTPDFTQAQKELEDLAKKIGETATPTPTPAVKTQLQAPSPIPSPKITPIKLPSDLGPESTGTPAPTVSPTPRP
jgi:tetratricopeptide (TPR) repeat protein